jgi:hypothetical protein
MTAPARLKRMVVLQLRAGGFARSFILVAALVLAGCNDEVPHDAGVAADLTGSDSVTGHDSHDAIDSSDGNVEDPLLRPGLYVATTPAACQINTLTLGEDETFRAEAIQGCDHPIPVGGRWAQFADVLERYLELYQPDPQGRPGLDLRLTLAYRVEGDLLWLRQRDGTMWFSLQYQGLR